MENTQQSKYKWYILTLAALTHTFAMAMPQMCMPVLFKEISDELGLTLVQVGMIWGIGNLIGIFISLFGGLIGDRFGTKRTLSVGCLVAGLTGALRGISGDFITLAATVTLFGLATTVLPMAVHKTCGVWFTGRRLGLANGVASMGMALGFMMGAMLSATVLSPLLGGWRNVLFLYGAISIVISLLWFVSKGSPAQVGSSVDYASIVPFRQALSRVVRIRGVWVLSGIMLGVGSCYQGMLGYLPLYLREVGWTAASADGALAAFNGISMLAAIPIALLSDRIGLRKPVLLCATLLTAIGVGLLSVVGGVVVWVAVLVAGIVRDGFMAIFSTMIIETEGIGARYAGTAMGLIYTVSRIGLVVSPPLGNSLAASGLSVPFIFWAALAVGALAGFYFLKETGARRRADLATIGETLTERL